MDRQPVLEGERLLLRPLREGDWDALFAVASNRELWAGHPSHDRWQEPVFRAFFDDALAKGGALAVIDKVTGEVIGSSRFQYSDRLADEGALEIGWSFLSRARWGQGYISRKAMANIGGRLTGETFVEERVGRPVEHVVYEITRESFATGPLAR